MVTVLKDKKVILRKPQTCHGCTMDMQPKQEAQSIAGIFDREFYAYYLCMPCVDFIDKKTEWVFDDFDENFSFGAVRDARYEFERFKPQAIDSTA